MLEGLLSFVSKFRARDLCNGGAGESGHLALTRLFAAFEPIAFELLDEPYFQSLGTNVSRNETLQRANRQKATLRTSGSARSVVRCVANENLMQVSLN